MEEIRVLALCIFKHKEKILVAELHEHENSEPFYRPLGGGVEFGERSENAIVREIKEEIGAEIKNVKLLKVLENSFTFRGSQRHEIVFVYSAKFSDKAFYKKEKIIGREPDHEFKAIWKPISDFKKGKNILYPQGLLELI